MFVLVVLELLSLNKVLTSFEQALYFLKIPEGPLSSQPCQQVSNAKLYASLGLTICFVQRLHVFFRKMLSLKVLLDVGPLRQPTTFLNDCNFMKVIIKWLNKLSVPVPFSLSSSSLLFLRKFCSDGRVYLISMLSLRLLTLLCGIQLVIRIATSATLDKGFVTRVNAKRASLARLKRHVLVRIALLSLSTSILVLSSSPLLQCNALCTRLRRWLQLRFDFDSTSNGRRIEVGS